MELKISELEIAKLNLQPGDTLMVKVRGDDFDYAETMESLRQSLQNAFPLARVMVLCMDKDHDIQVTVIKQGASDESDQGTESGT